jgi:hypothetical protein
MPAVTTPAARTLTAAALALVIAFALALAPSARAAGTRDFSYAGATQPSAPTADKPQSKLWFNDGSWWGSLWNGADFTIHRFDVAAQSWTDTKTVIDARSKSHADMLWDGAHLYALSSIIQGGASNDPSVRLYRFAYDAHARTYALDSGFPVRIFTPASSDDLETAVLDKDSRGTLWATFTYANSPGNCVTPSACPAGRSVRIAHSTTSDTTWTDRILPVANAPAVSGDDISTIVHFGSKIGVLFSDQIADPAGATADYFAWHNDGASDATWTLEQALAGPKMADDHLNVKAAPDGRVFAAIKTSRNDPGAGAPEDPLIMLLVRATNGTWSQTVFDTVASQDTRSQILLAPETGTVYQFATYPPSGTYEGGGEIYFKGTSMNAPAFAPGRGTPFIEMGPGDSINNISTTKQTVGAATGILGIAADDPATVYLHGFGALAPPPGGGSGGGTTPGGGGSAAAAKVSLRALTHRLRTVRRQKRLRVRMRVAGPTRVTLTLAYPRRGRKSIAIARVRLRFTKAGVRTATLKLTKRGRRLLAHRTKIKLSLILRARGADNVLGVRHVSLTLK